MTFSKAGDMQEDKDLDQLLNEHFAGRVVRKDLTKQIKEGANVPVYVLEYLLGMYCASDDPRSSRRACVTSKRCCPRTTCARMKPRK